MTRILNIHFDSRILLFTLSLGLNLLISIRHVFCYNLRNYVSSFGLKIVNTEHGDLHRTHAAEVIALDVHVRRYVYTR